MQEHFDGYKYAFLFGWGTWGEDIGDVSVRAVRWVRCLEMSLLHTEDVAFGLFCQLLKECSFSWMAESFDIDG